MINGKGEISKRSFDLPAERGGGVRNQSDLGHISTVFIGYWEGFDFRKKTARILVPSTEVRSIVSTCCLRQKRLSHRHWDPPSIALNVSRLRQISEILEWPVFQHSSTASNPMVYVSCKHLGRAVSRVLSMRSKRPTSCRLLARRTSELLDENDIKSMT